MENVCYSGGAQGSDYSWGEVANEHNHTVVHYIFNDHKSKYDNTIKLTKEELSLSDPFLIKANEIVQRKFPSKNKFTNNLLRRNYYQIKDSDAVYAISILKNGKVEGGTAWAVAMFIQNRSGPCYVFDQDENKWYEYNRSNEKFILMENIPPKPKGKWTGIGTRNINDNGVDAIISLFS